jgi:hypothetical protein
MTEWTEQPDGTWLRGPLVVQARNASADYRWEMHYQGVMLARDYATTREEAQQAADAWAANMLAQLKELEE